MSDHRPALFQRLPTIYRERDAEQVPPGQFEAYVGLIDEILGAIGDNIEALYQDHFIETCDDWVVPYIADLLGTSHLSGDPWTIRADVARTVALRRRKGTLGALEALSFNLTGWAAHAVELRERLVWTQHLNHRRPDRGGRPPLAEPRHRGDAVRHGTVTLRHPGMLNFYNGPFDPFAHVADLKPVGTSGFGSGTVPIGPARVNIPNLAVFLWRLKDFQVPVTLPAHIRTQDVVPAAAGDADAVGRYVVHPLARPLRLFNTHRFQANDDPPKLTHPDRTPGPMPPARLNDEPPAGNPEAYVAVGTYSGSRPGDPGADAVGLVVHVPENPFAGITWGLRGADLCAWEEGLNPPVRQHEIVVDPVHGRLLFGLADSATEGAALRRRLRVSHTYGFSGPTGANPIARGAPPETWLGEIPEIRTVSAHSGGTGLREALTGLSTPGTPVIVEIGDSMIHRLNLASIGDIGDEGGEPTLFLARSLWIRAATGQRPVIELRQPLRFRPLNTSGPGAEASMRQLNVRLEGLFIALARAPRPGLAIIAQAAVNRLLVDGCTLDPAGHIRLDGTPHGTRLDVQVTCRLGNDFGFDNPADAAAFTERPQIEFRRSITGRLLMGDEYFLDLADSIVDGGSGVDDSPPDFAVAAADGDPELEWGPSLTLAGMTAFGRMRVRSADGDGGIWVHRLEVREHQSGCIKNSYFAGDGDRLPPHHLCVPGSEAELAFVSHIFGEAGYGQLKLQVDRRILEQGPKADAMGAFGFLLNSHKWKNLTIRYREFMPVGVRPVLVPVT